MFFCDIVPWNTVSYYYCKWKNKDFIREVHEIQLVIIRQQNNRDKGFSEITENDTNYIKQG